MKPKKKPKKRGAMSATKKVAELMKQYEALQHAAHQMLSQAEEKTMFYMKRCAAWKALAKKQRSGARLVE